MKTQILSIFTILTLYLGVNAQNVNIPDAKFKAVLVANSNINTNNDSEISIAEASAYTGRILVYNKSVNSLSGIEAFVNITELNVSLNNFTSIDISKNTALTKLDFSNNNLTTIDVSKNTALTILSGSYNSLTSLDVSKNVSLDNLNVIQNNLTSLDVSKNTILTFLSCGYNSLTSLDVSNNTILTYLSCNKTDITSLDLSGNPVFAQLNCTRSSELTSLNIANGNNTNISNSAFRATSNSKLTCITVDDVAWSDANWTNIDSQTSFSANCSACYVNIPDANFKAALVADTAINTDNDTEISCAEATAVTGNLAVINKSISDLTGIEAFTNITGLYCNDNALTSLDISANTSLTSLVCRNNSLTNLDVSANTSLNYLECQVNSLTSLNVANGNNSLMGSGRFFAAANSNLTCIQVDNEAFSLANWTNSVDAGVSFSTNCTALSVDNFSLNQISIYPNPTNSILNIKLDSNLKRATIYSVLGAKVLETSSKNIKTSNLKSGLYLIKIESENGSIFTKRFMRE